MLSDTGLAPSQSRLVEREDRDFAERVQLPLSRIQPEDAKMADLLAYWRGLRPDGLLPSRKMLDPIEMKRFLGRLHIVDTSAERPESYFFRLWGSALNFDRGKDYGKMFLGDYPRGCWRRAVMQDYADVVKIGVPAYHVVQAQLDFVSYQYARLILPLAEDGRTVNQLIVHINERPTAEFCAAA
jgi:hypothetical protein